MRAKCTCLCRRQARCFLTWITQQTFLSWNGVCVCVCVCVCECVCVSARACLCVRACVGMRKGEVVDACSLCVCFSSLQDGALVTTVSLACCTSVSTLIRFLCCALLDRRLPPSAWRGRNFGFLNDALKRDLPGVIFWPSQPLAIVPFAGGIRRSSRPLALWGSASLKAAGESGTLHNNASPIRLRAHNNSLLLLAHAHESRLNWATHDPERARTAEDKLTRPKYGFDYTHTWLLVEGTPPYRVMSQSPPFCFPSPQNHERCETIQFVSTVLLSSSGDELVLA
jgi:hypothetical protein